MCTTWCKDLTPRATDRVPVAGQIALTARLRLLAQIAEVDKRFHRADRGCAAGVGIASDRGVARKCGRGIAAEAAGDDGIDAQLHRGQPRIEQDGIRDARERNDRRGHDAPPIGVSLSDRSWRAFVSRFVQFDAIGSSDGKQAWGNTGSGSMRSLQQQAMWNRGRVETTQREFGCQLQEGEGCATL